MNICFITSEYKGYTKTGGIASALDALVPELIKLKNNIIIVTRSDKNSRITKSDNLTIYPVVTKGIWAVFNFPYLISKILPKIIKKESIDVIETTLTRFPSLMVLHKIKNTPLVLRIYTSLSTLLGGSSLKKKANKFINYWGEKYNLLKADSLSIASHASFERILEYYKLSKNNIKCPVKLIPIGIPIEKNHIPKTQAKQFITKRLGTKLSNKILVTYLGAMHYHKGIDLIIKTAEWFEVHNHKLHFILIGRGDPCQFSDNNKLPGNCTYVGPIEEKEKRWFLRGSNIILIPSRWESFGIVSIEAMNQKIPLIAGNAGGLKEIVEDGISGWLINHTTKDVIDAIEKIISMPNEELDKVIETAWEHFQTNFDIEKTAQKTLDLYKELIK